jgi:hypothetical protein
VKRQPANRQPALAAGSDALRSKEQHVPLPVPLALRLVSDETFLPGARPPVLDNASSSTCLFKEVKRIKRKSGCDAWVNSGGARGGRNLMNMSGEVVLRRRYGKVLAAADGGRSGKLTGNERRYQEYTILKRGPDGGLVENRDVRLYVLSLDRSLLRIIAFARTVCEDQAYLTGLFCHVFPGITCSLHLKLHV